MTNLALLQAQGGMPATGVLIQFAFIIGIVYFLLIAPQRRERKRHQELLAELKPGDQVVTAGGLMGEIISIRDEAVTVKTGDARVVVERARIARKVTAPAPV